MQISPSDLPWWGWLLCSVIAWGTCIGFASPKEEPVAGGVVAFLAVISGLIGVVTGGMFVLLVLQWVHT